MAPDSSNTYVQKCTRIRTHIFTPLYLKKKKKKRKLHVRNKACKHYYPPGWWWSQVTDCTPPEWQKRHICLCVFACAHLHLCVWVRERWWDGKCFRQTGDASLSAAAPTQVSNFMQRRRKANSRPTLPTWSLLVIQYRVAPNVVMYTLLMFYKVIKREETVS